MPRCSRIFLATSGSSITEISRMGPRYEARGAYRIETSSMRNVVVLLPLVSTRKRRRMLWPL